MTDQEPSFGNTPEELDGSAPPPAKTPWWRRWWAIVLWVILAIIILGAIFGDGDDTATDDTTAASDTTVITTTAASDTTAVDEATTTSVLDATTTSPPTTTTAATTTTTAPTTTTQAGPQPIFGDGTQLVGTDIPPGTYEAFDLGAFGCYWERLSDLSGELEAILANDNADNHAIVEIAESDEAFNSAGCGDWYELTEVDEPMTEIPPGTWAVGLQIAPGRYRAEVTGFCYWARLSGFSGELGDIIANDNVDSGSAIVDISESDTGFDSSDCGVWSRAD